MTVSPTEIEAEDAWVRYWGLVPPATGLVLPDPYRKPYRKQSLIVPHTWFEAPLKTQLPLVNPIALRADLPLLSDVMQLAYCGWETGGYPGYWRGFCADWDRDLASYSGPISPAEAFRKWVAAQHFRRDHHTGPVIEGYRWQSFSRVAVLPPGITRVEAVRIGGEEFPVAQRDAARLLWEARRVRPDFEGFEPISLIACPSGPGPVGAVLAGGAWFEAEPLEMPDRNESIRSIAGSDESQACYRQIAEGTGYLRIPTLSVPVGESISRFEEWLPKDADVKRALVVDLRGNQGGAAPPAIALLSRLLGTGALERGLRFGYRLKRSCITDALSWGHAQAQLCGAARPLLSRTKAQLQSILDAIALDAVGESSDSGDKISFEEQTARWNYSQRTRSGPARVLILIDGNCGSDGEFLTYLLASAPASLVIGANTAGCAQFIRPGYFVLPESKIVFRVAMGSSNLYGDGRAFDGYGLQVDVALPRGARLDRENLLRLVKLAGR